jgi:hypothetical protein
MILMQVKEEFNKEGNPEWLPMEGSPDFPSGFVSLARAEQCMIWKTLFFHATNLCSAKYMCRSRMEILYESCKDW